MSLPWIRVNVALLDDADVRQFGTVLYPRLEAFTARAAAGGHLCALWGKFAEHQPDGRAARRDDEQMEEWAQWKGKAGTFATAFRDRFVGTDGVIRLWDEYQGAALDKREKDRQRKEKERKDKERTVRGLSRGHSNGQSTDADADRPSDRPRDVRVTSHRNGTETVRTTQKAGSTHRSQLGRTPSTSAVENPAEQPAPLSSHEDATTNDEPPDGAVKLRDVRSPTPPIAEPEPPAPVESADPNDALPAAAHNLLHAFYRKATPKRYADVLSQLDATLTSRGVTFESGVVWAADREHLAWACDQTIRSGIHDADKAIVFVLKKLRDTRHEVLSARLKAEEARPLTPVTPAAPVEA